MNGIRHGFRLTDPGQTFVRVETANYSSATRPDRKQAAEKQLREELVKGHVVVSDQKPTIVKAIGAVPKDNSPELRLITDASRPHAASLNSYMSLESFKFDGVDTAVGFLQKDHYQCKVDLRHGYRSIPIHPDDYRLCGSKWLFEGAARPTFMLDTRLCFGASKAPQIFQRITSSVIRMLHRRGINTSIVYLDDFYICAPSYPKCSDNSLIVDAYTDRSNKAVLSV